MIIMNWEKLSSIGAWSAGIATVIFLLFKRVIGQYYYIFIAIVLVFSSLFIIATAMHWINKLISKKRKKSK